MTANGQRADWHHSTGRAHRPGVPKVIGADVELSNFILGISEPAGTGATASRWLLAAVPGISSGSIATTYAIDWGRKYLPEDGSCVYVDSDHLEVALSETFSAFDHVARWRAMLAVVRTALRRVNDELPPGRRLQVLANCSDGQGNSYGSHVNVLLTREAWDNIFCRRAHFLAYLAAFQISSIVITGQGKVGAERGRPDVDFQLSQRADFIETLVSLDTMVNRGVVNSRDEPLCGMASHSGDPSLARLHVIFFDSTLCQVATLLRVGMLQMIVAMLEAGWVNADLALDDPLDALERYSRDPGLRARARLVNGASWTAVELQCGFLDEAKRFEARGGFDGIVPEARGLIALWEDSLIRLRTRDFDALGRRLDWVLKRRLLQGVLDRRPDLTWQSPALKHLDQLYSSIEESDGLFWPVEQAGQVDTVVDEAAVERSRHEPTPDTRAWTRAHLLRLAGQQRVEEVDWDRVRFRIPTGRWPNTRSRTVHMPLPFGDTRADNERHFADGAPLVAVLEALQASDEPYAADPAAIVPAFWTIRIGEDR